MTTLAQPVAQNGSAGWRVLARDDRGKYALSLAETAAELAEAQALRFEIFNLELGEGFAESFLTGRDEDQYDLTCQHLLVREVATGLLVGTYRLQTGLNALAHLGYYSEQEFDLSPFENVRPQVIELGRACVHQAHRNLRVLAMLWRGIADVAVRSQSRYLIGCSSLSSVNAGEGLALYQELSRQHLAAPAFLTQPQLHCRCVVVEPLPAAPRPPKLLAAYLSLGARICGPPAIDREFGTIDFLTIIDLEQLDPAAARLYLGPSWSPPSAVSVA